MNENIFAPDLPMLVKLGSLAVHIEEFLSSGGHDFDLAAIQALLQDPDVKQWLAVMNSMALLPKKRR